MPVGSSSREAETVCRIAPFCGRSLRVFRRSLGKGRFFNDRDLFAWYLFLGQAVLDHPIISSYVYREPGCSCPYCNRAQPRTARRRDGDRSSRAPDGWPEKSQPNACLFELLVAAAYCRQGGQVTFLEERPGVAKTSDMDVALNGTNWAVECKRLEGANTRKLNGGPGTVASGCPRTP